MSDDLDECPHGLGDPAWCVLCNGREKRERAARNVEVYRFVAKYASTVSCGHQAVEGDVLVHMADERIVCEACAP